MGVLDSIFLGVALSMDACAVGMTNGMTFPRLNGKKTLIIALFFGVFQGLMPLFGYFVTDFFASYFMETFEKVSSVVSFLILALLGGKMIFDGVKEMSRAKRAKNSPSCKECEDAGEAIEKEKEFSYGKLLLQAVATSIDALAVGVTLKMAAISAGGLALGIFGTVGVICAVTFALSYAAVHIGKVVGAGLADKAEVVGGVMLILIGVKLLLEGLL